MANDRDNSETQAQDIHWLSEDSLENFICAKDDSEDLVFVQSLTYKVNMFKFAKPFSPKDLVGPFFHLATAHGIEAEGASIVKDFSTSDKSAEMMTKLITSIQSHLGNGVESDGSE